MKKLGIILFVAAVAAGIVLAKMFSFGSIPIDLPSFSFVTGVEGSGNVITQKREVSGFTKIEAGGAFQVEVVAGQDFGLEIQADDNLVPLIQTKVDGSTLKLDTQKRYSTRNRVKVKITAPEINEIHVSGATRFNVSGIENQKMFVDISGASRVELNGMAEVLNVEMGGASKLDASNFKSAKVKVDGGGASSAKVNVSAELDVDLGGASRLAYSGDPKVVNRNTSGVARIRRID